MARTLDTLSPESRAVWRRWISRPPCCGGCGSWAFSPAVSSRRCTAPPFGGSTAYGVLDTVVALRDGDARRSHCNKK